MKFRIIVVLVVLNAVVISFLNSCNRYSGGEKRGIVPYIEPEKKGREPDDPPPPPPPPPPLGTESYGSTLSVNYYSLEEVARDVLCGKYGSELQQMLADEVAKCISSLADSNIIELSGKISVLSCNSVKDKKGILFDTDYIVTPILKGFYGEEAKAMLKLLMQNDENSMED